MGPTKKKLACLSLAVAAGATMSAGGGIAGFETLMVGGFVLAICAVVLGCTLIAVRAINYHARLTVRAVEKSNRAVTEIWESGFEQGARDERSRVQPKLTPVSVECEHCHHIVPVRRVS